MKSSRCFLLYVLYCCCLGRIGGKGFADRQGFDLLQGRFVSLEYFLRQGKPEYFAHAREIIIGDP